MHFAYKIKLIIAVICYQNLPIGQRTFALLDSSKSINIKSISTAATVYLCQLLFKIARIIVYTVFSLGNWNL